MFIRNVLLFKADFLRRNIFFFSFIYRHLQFLFRKPFKWCSLILLGVHSHVCRLVIKACRIGHHVSIMRICHVWRIHYVLWIYRLVLVLHWRHLWHLIVLIVHRLWLRLVGWILIYWLWNRIVELLLDRRCQKWRYWRCVHWLCVGFRRSASLSFLLLFRSNWGSRREFSLSPRTLFSAIVSLCYWGDISRYTLLS